MIEPIPHVPCQCAECKKKRNLEKLKQACSEMTIRDLETVADMSEIMANKERIQ